MKVWVLFYWFNSPDEGGIIGIFSTKELAEEALEKSRTEGCPMTDAWIKACTLDTNF